VLAKNLIYVLAVLVPGLHALGIVTAINAVMKTRTSQGAIAWSLALVTLPYFTLPLYWVFGRDRFHGYITSRRDEGEGIAHLRQALADAPADIAPLPNTDHSVYTVLNRLAQTPFLPGNRAQLLVDGTATFDAIFAGIDSAKRYILVQFFIVHDDEIGRELKARLIKKAREGVRTYFLYDEIGCRALPNRYLRELRAAGIRAEPFRSSRITRFQINFRNHRKIVVMDGRHAYVGGDNVGDEYLGRSTRLGHWRDTHVAISGPAVKPVQLSFVDDWHWSTGEVPELDWELDDRPGDQPVLVLPSGPADYLETCTLLFVSAIESARRRFWITSPYFVPSGAILTALQLAVLRGVDVRIILPAKPDHLAVYLASFAYLKDTLPFGVKLYRYQDGFLHQKVFLVDDNLASIGTANLDTRSFRLQFEISLLFAQTSFVAEVEKMLVADFARCRPVQMEDVAGRSLFFKLAVQVSRLMSPAL
jgi:cardiolipin synthase A/B